jgi:hypothetical protein
VGTRQCPFFRLNTDQIFILQVPFLDVVVGDFKTPNELQLVRWVLSILSHLVICMKGPLPNDPLP